MADEPEPAPEPGVYEANEAGWYCEPDLGLVIDGELHPLSSPTTLRSSGLGVRRYTFERHKIVARVARDRAA